MVYSYEKLNYMEDKLLCSIKRGPGLILSGNNPHIYTAATALLSSQGNWISFKLTHGEIEKCGIDFLFLEHARSGLCVV